MPPALSDQLADGGTLVIPLGTETRSQRLVRIRRDGDRLSEQNLGAVRFVPLVYESDPVRPALESSDPAAP